MTKQSSQYELDYLYAESLFKLGNLKDAAIEFHDFLDSKPPVKYLPHAKMRMGDCYRHLGDKETASIYYEELITEFPKAPSLKQLENVWLKLRNSWLNRLSGSDQVKIHCDCSRGSSCDATHWLCWMEDCSFVRFASSVEKQAVFGGVPEVAAREHLKALVQFVQSLCDRSNLSFDDIDVIAVTQGPGLIGSLLVGIFAKSLALMLDKPGSRSCYAHLHGALLEVDSEPQSISHVSA